MEISQVKTIMEAMADNSRLLILQALIKKPLCVEELAGCLGLSSSTVSFHLKKLKSARLVEKEKEQYYTIFRVEKEILKLPLIKFLEFENPAKDAQQEREVKIRQQVLKSFFVDGSLLRIPVQHKKLQIILEELATKFRYGIQYSETEVNEILTKFNEDYCTLRRMLVGEGFMGRARGTYWLIAPNETIDQKPMAKLPQKGEKKMDERQELKRAYKESNIPAGVIQIKNLRNGKIFLKGSKNLSSALNSARFQLDFGSHPSKDLQQDWKNFGPDAFEFTILETITPPEDGSKISQDDVKKLEKHLVQKLESCGTKGYNE
ncbi:MAG: metalloregulator ArsR/SmtB family transcription factor [Candidatus Riflebacteria bacterium]|nr:metalloregulator ArsR/SmtB family transcription factor [Candidatus Riflebacteria bacterium]